MICFIDGMKTGLIYRSGDHFLQGSVGSSILPDSVGIVATSD
jgi:hypothetical protein